MPELEKAAGPVIFTCCSHCEHTDPCGRHDMPCEHGCNDIPENDDE